MTSSPFIFLLGMAFVVFLFLLVQLAFPILPPPADPTSPSLTSPSLTSPSLSPTPAGPPRGFDLCVIARSHVGQQHYWGALAMSLLAAAHRANETVFLTFVDTEHDFERHFRGRSALLGFVAAIQPLVLADALALAVSPLSPADVLAYQRRVRAEPSQPDFGYLATDLALEALLSLPGDPCRYVLFTNADNLYHADLLRSTAHARERGTDLVGMFMSSRYERKAPQPWEVHERAGRNVLLRSQLKYAGVDLGAVLYRTSLFRDHPDLRFMLIPSDYWIADGQLIQKASELSNVSKVVIQEILFMHQ